MICSSVNLFFTVQFPFRSYWTLNRFVAVYWGQVRRHAIITVVKDQYSVGVPYSIADGQEGYWGIPLDKNKKWLVDLIEGFVVNRSDVNSLRFLVHTNHGVALALRPEEPLRHANLELLVAKAANTALQDAAPKSAARRP